MTVRLYVRLTCQGPRASALYSHMQLRPARLLATTNNVSSSLGNAVPGPGGRPRAGVVSGVCLYGSGFRLRRLLRLLGAQKNRAVFTKLNLKSPGVSPSSFYRCLYFTYHVFLYTVETATSKRQRQRPLSDGTSQGRQAFSGKAA